MKINDILVETDEKILSMMVDKFRKTQGTFNNASHKFFSVRKALANELDGDMKDEAQKVDRSEFFNFLKANKPQPPQKPKLVEPTQDDLDKAGNVYNLINTWVNKYHEHYSPEEIVDVLYSSVVGNFEDRVFINKEVNSAITKLKIDRDQKSRDQSKSEINKKVNVTRADVESAKNTDIYYDVLNRIKRDIDNQPRTPGQKPLKPAKIFGYIKKQLEGFYDSLSVESWKKGDEKTAKENLLKREMVKNLKLSEFMEWYRN